jgi:hypothetical protein
MRLGTHLFPARSKHVERALITGIFIYVIRNIFVQ